MAPITPTPGQRRLLERHLDELEVWNRRLNLTAVPRDRAWDRHVVETLGLLDAAALPVGADVVDIGSGGGIPGLVIAVVRPDLAVTLVEADRRKAGFLIHVAGLLELANVTVAARRAEEMGRDGEHHARHDVVVSRATAPPILLVELAMPLLKPAGRLWALVGDAAAAEVAVGRRDGVRAWAATPGILAVERSAG